MSQEAGNDSKMAWDEFTNRPLKNVTLQEIEAAFAQALQQLTGQAYKVDLLRIDMKSESNAWFKDTALIDVKVSKEAQKSDGGPFG